METSNANDWGATIKNSHGWRKPGDFIMFADDDNSCTPDALETVRTVVQHDYDALCIFRIKCVVHAQPAENFIPDLDRNGEAEVGNADTGAPLSEPSARVDPSPNSAQQCGACSEATVRTLFDLAGLNLSLVPHQIVCRQL